MKATQSLMGWRQKQSHFVFNNLSAISLASHLPRASFPFMAHTPKWLNYATKDQCKISPLPSVSRQVGFPALNLKIIGLWSLSGI